MTSINLAAVLAPGRGARRQPISVLLLGAAALVVGSGCTVYQGSARDFTPARLNHEPGWLKAGPVPFHPQAHDQDCGAAALAMVLDYWGVKATRDEIWRAADPGLARGVKAGQLREQARKKGLAAFLLKGDLKDIERELARGRPVIVGLVKPYRTTSFGHYEVVVAYHPGRQEIVTLDPAHGYRRNQVKGFLEEWKPAHHVALFVFPKPVAGR